jgi:putative ABC transport system permease protein
LLRSLGKLFAVSPGFDETNLYTVQIKTGGDRYASDTATWRFYRRTLEAVRAHTGVAAAALTSQLPLSGDFDAWGIHLESRPSPNPAQDPSAFRYAISPGYIETMGIPVVKGRGILETDRPGQPPVVLISESLGRRLWPGQDPLGERIRVGDPAKGDWRTIVGIVGDVRHVSLSDQGTDAVYVPEEQWFFADNIMTLVVRPRSSVDLATLSTALRETIWSVDKDQPIVRAERMATLVAETASQRRFALMLFELFALVALILAAAGIYGVLAGSVVERVRELGVRAALGASRKDIVSLVIRQGIGPVATGTLLGLLIAVGVTRAISGLLFGVSALDPATYGGVTLLLAAVAVGACWVPAWRAARVDPMVTLRSE